MFSIDYCPYPSDTGGRFHVVRETEDSTKVTYEILAEATTKREANKLLRYELSRYLSHAAHHASNPDATWLLANRAIAVL